MSPRNSQAVIAQKILRWYGWFIDSGLSSLSWEWEQLEVELELLLAFSYVERFELIDCNSVPYIIFSKNSNSLADAAWPPKHRFFSFKHHPEASTLFSG